MILIFQSMFSCPRCNPPLIFTNAGCELICPAGQIPFLNFYCQPETSCDLKDENVCVPACTLPKINVSHTCQISKGAFVLNGAKVEACPQFFSQDGDYKFCVSTCSSNRILVGSECVSCAPAFKNGDVCVDSCDSLSFRFNFSCVKSCPEMTNSYSGSCVSSVGNLIGIDGQFQSGCAHFRKGSFCIEKCEIGADSDGFCTISSDFVLDGLYVESCPGKSQGQFCVDACSGDFGDNGGTICSTTGDGFIQENVWVTVCGVDFGFIQGVKCVKSCEFGFATLYNNYCFSSSPNASFSLIQDFVWVEKCDLGKVIQGNHCMDSCSNKFGLDVDSNICISYPPKAGLFLFNNKWVQVCPQPFVLQEIYCQPVCDLYFGSVNFVCTNLNGNKVISNGIWKEKCNLNEFLHQKQCFLVCPTEFAGYSGLCINSPPISFFLAIHNIWQTPCLTGVYQDSICINNCNIGYEIISFQCVQCRLFDPIQSKCTQLCSILSENSTNCISKCDECQSQIKLDSGQIQCVTHCNGDRFLLGDRCVKTCPIYKSGIFCVDSCSKNQFLNNSQCVDNCTFGKYELNAISQKICIDNNQCSKFKAITLNSQLNAYECMDSCEFMNNLVNGQLNCSQSLSGGQFYQARLDTIFGQVIIKCDTYYVLQTRECVYKCPLNTFLNITMDFCQPLCSQFINYENGQFSCLEICPSNHDQFQVCTSSCNLIMKNGQCTDSCVAQHNGICELQTQDFENYFHNKKSQGCMQLFTPLLNQFCTAENIHFNFNSQIINVLSLTKKQQGIYCNFSGIDLVNSSIENIIFILNISNLDTTGCQSINIALFSQLINSTLKKIYISGNINISGNYKVSALSIFSHNSQVQVSSTLTLNENSEDYPQLQSIIGLIQLTDYIQDITKLNITTIKLYDKFELTLVYQQGQDIIIFEKQVRNALNASWYINGSYIPCYDMPNQFCISNNGKMTQLCVGASCHDRTLNTSCNPDYNQIYFGMQCVNSCPSGYSVYQGIVAKYCLLNCPINYKSISRICVCQGFIYEGKCILNCPIGFEKQGETCIITCLQLNNQCVTQCPVGYIQNGKSCDVNNVFVDCVPGQYLQAGQCVKVCENTVRYKNSCLPCVYGGFNIATNECDVTCKQKVCLPICKEGFYLNYADMTCLKDKEQRIDQNYTLVFCPAPTWNLNQKCQLECPFNYLALSDRSYRLCSPSCKMNQVNQTNICQSSCNQTFFIDQYNNCIDKCPFIIENNKCTSKCSQMMYLINDIHCRWICPFFIYDQPYYIFDQLNVNSLPFNIQGQCTENCSFNPFTYVKVRDNMKQCIKCDLFSTSYFECLAYSNISQFCNSMTFQLFKDSSVGYIIYICNDGNCKNQYSQIITLTFLDGKPITITECIDSCPNFLNESASLCVDSCSPKAFQDNFCIDVCLVDQENFIMFNSICSNSCGFLVNTYVVNNYYGYFCERACQDFHNFVLEQTINGVDLKVCSEKCNEDQIVYKNTCVNKPIQKVIYSENKTCQLVNCFGESCKCFEVQIDECLPPFFIIDEKTQFRCVKSCKNQRFIPVYQISILIYVQCQDNCPQDTFINSSNFCVSLNSPTCKVWFLSPENDFFCDSNCGVNNLVSYPYTYLPDTQNPRCTDLCKSLQKFYPDAPIIVLKGTICVDFAPNLCASIQILADFSCLAQNECPTSTVTNASWQFPNTPQCPSCEDGLFATNSGCVFACPEPLVGDFKRGICVEMASNQQFKMVQNRKILAPACVGSIIICCSKLEFVTSMRECISKPSMVLNPYQGGECDSFISQEEDQPNLCTNCTFALRPSGLFYECINDCRSDYFNARTRLCEDTLVVYNMEHLIFPVFGDEIKRNVGIQQLGIVIGFLVIFILCASGIYLWLILAKNRRNLIVSFVDYRVKGIIISKDDQQTSYSGFLSGTEDRIFELA
ncbi:Cysteine-rich membrane protein 2 [Spironucleus salmonicida]|uniref:Cysteine-rich membrane protein 2 n=1 Tax=Spironucleus salmonicida TaxID=348837 RepID=V6LX28_9EUKA|nr:Cysteine-rich membrane protein 2 [Spironucleus salmonicida]|eukprot:EST49145.1 Cysteine-rich membrane protein 2 [Spironucleus salmonicida]